MVNIYKNSRKIEMNLFKKNDWFCVITKAPIFIICL